MVRMAAQSRLALLAAVALAGSARADVWVVDATGAGDFVDLPQAVAAASDGDTLLVRAGSYRGFVLDDKVLAIVREAGSGPVQVGPVRISNLFTPQAVVLSGLAIDGADEDSTGSKTALELANLLAPIRIQDCVIRAADKQPHFEVFPLPGFTAVRSTSAADVVFSRCEIRGGAGADGAETDRPGGYGGIGLAAQNSILGLFDTIVEGGSGGYGHSGGKGGTGLDQSGGFLGVVGGRIRGGKGGTSDFVFNGGDGGIGLHLKQFASAKLRDVWLSGGIAVLGGESGAPLVTQSGSSFLEYAGTARELDCTPQAFEGQTIAFTVHGEAGDRVWLAASEATQLAYSDVWKGPSTLLGPTAVSLEPLGTIGASGVLEVQRPVPDLPPGEEALLRHVQLLVTDAQGGRTCGTSLSMVVVAGAAGN